MSQLHGKLDFVCVGRIVCSSLKFRRRGEEREAVMEHTTEWHNVDRKG